MNVGDEASDHALSRAALDTLPVGVAVLDPEAEIVRTNAAWETAASEGDPLRPVAGSDYLAVCAESDHEYANESRDGIESVLSGDRESFTLEYPCHTPTRRRWFLLRAAAFEHDGATYGVLANSEITDRKLAELDAERTADRLEDERETLALLNGIVRHDIRNDLNVVLGWADNLADHVSGAGREQLDRIRESAAHAITLTETLGDLADALGADESALEPVELGPVLREEIEKTVSAQQWRAETVTIDGPNEYPDVRVLADGLLSSVFSNLLSNAVLHNDNEEPRVEVSIEADAETVEVRIADDGPGIPEELRDTVFGRGEKGLESPGTGLGLYLVDTLVDRYGGRVELRGNEPRGTVAVVELGRT